MLVAADPQSERVLPIEAQVVGLRRDLGRPGDECPVEPALEHWPAFDLAPGPGEAASEP